VQENGPQDSLAQACPTPLIFELADHLQQFVGIVVKPTGLAPRGAAIPIDGGSRSGFRLARFFKIVWGLGGRHPWAKSGRAQSPYRDRAARILSFYCLIS